MEIQQNERLIRLPEVLHIVGMKKTAWYEGIKDGKHPAPIKRSSRDVVWQLSKVMRVVEDTITRAESDSKPQ